MPGGSACYGVTGVRSAVSEVVPKVNQCADVALAGGAGPDAEGYGGLRVVELLQVPQAENLAVEGSPRLNRLSYAALHLAARNRAARTRDLG